MRKRLRIPARSFIAVAEITRPLGKIRRSLTNAYYAQGPTNIPPGPPDGSFQPAFHNSEARGRTYALAPSLFPAVGVRFGFVHRGVRWISLRYVQTVR
jgi:hypothetical protein